MTEETMLQHIKDAFPNIAWKKHHFLTHGWDHIIVILDDAFVFRAPKDTPKDLRSELSDEVRLLAQLRKRLPVGIPHYTHISKDGTVAGYPLLRGQELSPSAYASLSHMEQESWKQQIAQFLTIMHATPRPLADACHVRIDDPHEGHTLLMHDAQEMLYPRLKPSEVSAIEALLHQIHNILDQTYATVLVHNDLTWEHILWDGEQQQMNILDFSDRIWGDPACDFAGLWAYGQDTVQEIYSLYAGPKDNALMHRSQLYFQRIPLFTMKDALEGHPCSFEEGRAQLHAYLHISD